MRRPLSPDALTIGVARRFATDTRANLLLQDLGALSALVNDPRAPAQLIFAGNSHPLDVPSKTVLQQVAQLTRGARSVGKVAFVEDDDVDVGRDLVQGARRPAQLGRSLGAEYSGRLQPS